MPDSEANDRARIPQWAIVTAVLLNSVAVLVLGPLAWWALERIVDHGNALSVVASNRFDAKDGEELKGRVRRLEDFMANGIPPKWFVDRVDKLETRLERIETAIGVGKRSP